MNSILLNTNKYREILGINRRNQEYVRQYNPLKSKKISDNKILSKRILNKAGIKTPKTIKIIRTKNQLNFFDWDSLPKSFVVKPNRGTGGNGIIVFYGQKKGELAWIRSNHQVMNKEQLRIHFEKILDGSFSMGDANDIVLIEERLLNHSVLKKYSFRGVPDIRIIVFNKVPVMAMIRFPTKFSDGKANLHAGGICAGIDIASGLTTNAIQLKRRSFFENTYASVDYTADFKENQPLKGIKIPYWDEILETAIKCQEITNIGFLGVDIAIDDNNGPLVFELNARPGLGIQMANNTGLRPRLERVKGIEIKSMKRAIRLAKTLFGGEIEEEIESLSGKDVVNLIEKITIYFNKESNEKPKKDENKLQVVKALLDTGILTSRIDEGLANRMGYNKTIEYFKSLDIPQSFESIEEAKKYSEKLNIDYKKYPDLLRPGIIVENAKVRIKPTINLDIKISGDTKDIEAIVSTQKETIYPLLLGRKELKNYLIDASKTFVK
jgi:alpha-L-glutamate ligase-like protein